jgi:hypothetical protein
MTFMTIFSSVVFADISRLHVLRNLGFLYKVFPGKWENVPSIMAVGCNGKHAREVMKLTRRVSRQVDCKRMQKFDPKNWTSCCSNSNKSRRMD